MFRGWVRVCVPSPSVVTVHLSMKFCVAPLSRRARTLAVLCHMYMGIEIVIESFTILYIVATAKLEAFTTWHCKNLLSCCTRQDTCSVPHCSFLL